MPGDLVPREVAPGEIAPDPGITVPERVLPEPRGGAGGDARPAPSAAEAPVPPGGGDPGILAPLPDGTKRQPGRQDPPASAAPR